LKEKSYDFALKIVGLYKELIEKKEFVLSKQLLRCGTAIGAMVREAEYAQSRGDFINKLSVALKEANETGYWLNLLSDSKFILPQQYKVADTSCTDIKIITASIKTAKKAVNNE
jgi:four helix bundle protein